MRENYLEEYYSFLRFPSVSTDDQYKQKLEECARWLVEKLTSIGLETKLVPTRGHPIIWARNKHQPGRRTVLIYGHYDVQPPDPLELWDARGNRSRNQSDRTKDGLAFRYFWRRRCQSNHRVSATARHAS